ncbi:MAG: hypothetical protein HYZ23_06145 [Chloroflexi bacterium]|nr:hypothetical protein [Chloroflexota bacterium]
MNNDLFANSLYVIRQNWGLVLFLLAFIFWGTLLVFAFLKKTAPRQFSDSELIALALGGWPLPALLVSLLIIFLRIVLPYTPALILALAVALAGAGWAIRVVWRKITFAFLPPVLFFLVFVFLRLGFAAETILPSYFDSAEHYRIIQVILDSQRGINFAWPTNAYYHLGYHFIIAAINLITRAAVGQTMLLFGQIVLAAIPMPLWFLIHRATESKTAAIFGVILAAFGWFMPAHAVNWGKYPALLSLLLIQFTLGVLALKHRGLLVLSAIVSIFIHTRAAILFGACGAAWIASDLWMRQPSMRRVMLAALTLAMLATLTLYIGGNPILDPILKPYWIWITLLTGLLAGSVSPSFPRLTFFPVAVMLFMLIGLFIPATSNLTLLDRPLVEITLFLPLAFLGGLGATRLPKFAVIALAVVIVAHAALTYDFSPSDCCQLVTRDDATALDWMGRHLPADARVGISSANLNFDAYGRPMLAAGVDAGIWVAPLTGRLSVPLPDSADFTSQPTRDLLCGQQVTYIYIGSKAQSFDPNVFETIQTWYDVIFSLPNAKIIQVINCNVQ